MTVVDALRRATEHLATAGVESASFDAESLLRHATGWDRAKLLAQPHIQVPPPTLDRFFALIGERAKRHPLQHLTGVQGFWRHEFHVTPDVLIPRPETEILVEAAVGFLRGHPRATVVDVGTGSGCIALSLAGEAPDAEIHATDISAAALAVARRNADRLGVDRVRFHMGDLLAPVPGLAGKVDLIVSNPPYVDSADAPTIAPEVRDHEPAIALFPPGDAYSTYRRLVPEAARFTRAGGLVILEIGQGMSDQVSDICRQAGFVVDAVLPDLQSIPRAIVARRP